jgi:hypothetical protein
MIKDRSKHKHAPIVSMLGDGQESIVRWHVDYRDGTPVEEVHRSKVDGRDFFQCSCGGTYKWKPLRYKQEWCPHIYGVCFHLVYEEAIQDFLQAGLIRRTGLYDNRGQPFYERIPDSELSDRARAEGKRLGWWGEEDQAQNALGLDTKKPLPKNVR